MFVFLSLVLLSNPASGSLAAGLLGFASSRLRLLEAGFLVVPTHFPDALRNHFL